MIALKKENISTRQVILMILKRKQEQTVAELALEVGITEMAVRRHIRGLEAEGLVNSRIERKSMGRPLHKYYLTETGEESFPRNYGELSIGLLQDLEKLTGRDVIDKLFEQRKDRLYEKYDLEMKGSFHDRIEALARIQNNNGYMVEYKQLDENTYEFVEYNCPISQVAKKYSIACQCEQQLFQQLLETDHIERRACMAKENSTSCVYHVQASSTRERKREHNE